MATKLTLKTHAPTCPVCRGTGGVKVPFLLALFAVKISQPCQACGGAGAVPAKILAADPGNSSVLCKYVAGFYWN